MNNDKLRKAVEYADGWEWHEDMIWPLWPTEHFKCNPNMNIRPILDALAAQLVRQIDAIEGYDHHVVVMRRATEICEGVIFNGKYLVRSEDNGRTDNTINACVEYYEKATKTPDEILADAVVGLGAGYKVSDLHYALHNTDRTGIEMLPDIFVRDWRVAGALMELCKNLPFNKMGKDLSVYFGNPDWFCEIWSAAPHRNIVKINESLPRAICEACARALGAIE